MNPEAHAPQPVPTEEVADKDSYLGDPNRSGATRGEAIFGDKHAQFEGLTVNDVSPEGQAVAEKYLAGDATKEAATHAAAILAINQAAQMGDWDQSRIDLAKKELDSKQQVK